MMGTAVVLRRGSAAFCKIVGVARRFSRQQLAVQEECGEEVCIIRGWEERYFNMTALLHAESFHHCVLFGDTMVKAWASTCAPPHGRDGSWVSVEYSRVGGVVAHVGQVRGLYQLMLPVLREQHEPLRLALVDLYGVGHSPGTAVTHVRPGTPVHLEYFVPISIIENAVTLAWLGDGSV